MRGPVAVLVLLAAPALAAAGPPRIALQAPAACPDRAAFLALVRQHADGAAVEVPADVRVERAGGRWIATVTLQGTDGRRFEGATCAEVMDAAALVIAFATDGSVSSAHTASEPPPHSSDAARIVRSAPPFASPPVALRARAGALGDVGTLPAAAVAAEVSMSAWRGRVGLELSVAFFGANSATAPGDTSQVAPVGLWTSGLRACRGIWFAAACLGGEAGLMSVDAGELDGGAKAAALWSAATASAWVRRRLAGPAGVYVGAELVAAAVRPRFVFDDDTGLHRPSRFAGRILMGLELDVR